jgi:hypothetical protein
MNHSNELGLSDPDIALDLKYTFSGARDAHHRHSESASYREKAAWWRWF